MSLSGWFGQAKPTRAELAQKHETEINELKTEIVDLKSANELLKASHGTPLDGSTETAVNETWFTQETSEVVDKLKSTIKDIEKNHADEIRQLEEKTKTLKKDYETQIQAILDEYNSYIEELSEIISTLQKENTAITSENTQVKNENQQLKEIRQVPIKNCPPLLLYPDLLFHPRWIKNKAALTQPDEHSLTMEASKDGYSKKQPA